MKNNNNHSADYTTFFPNYQLFLPMDIGVNISESSPVRVISKLLEGLDYRYLMQAYSKSKGRKHKIEADKWLTKFYKKLKIKVNDFRHSFNENNNTEFNDIYEIEKHLEKEISDRNIEFVYGKGVRKTQQQRNYETVTSYIAKENEYNMHLKICGNRNSYSKKDKDATFMRMKEDYMKNGQLKPAYNLQISVNSEYIVGLDLFPNPTDVRTLIPFLSVLESKNLKFKNIVADAGYESEENYEYLFNNNYTSYIKPQNYEKQKTRKFKHDISKVKNMSFNEETDTYTCVNNQKLELLKGDLEC